MKKSETFKAEIFGNPVDYLNASTNVLFSTLRQYSEYKGEHQPALADFAQNVLLTVNSTLAFDAVDLGSDASRSLHRICRNIVDKTTAPEDKEYVSRIKPYLTQIKSIPDRNTQMDLCYIALHDLHTQNALRDYQAGLGRRFDTFTGIKNMSGSYDKLVIAIGISNAKKVKDTLLEHLVIAPATEIFLQSLTNDYIYVLTEVDEISKKMVFQIWLELQQGCV